MLTEGEVFENEILSRTESTDNPAQKMPGGNSHGKNLIGTSQIELGVKLLILRMFDLLANDRIVSGLPTIRQESGAGLLRVARFTNGIPGQRKAIPKHKAASYLRFAYQAHHL